tara:strand:- start:232 stop:462 length:231 start_codon:yes stop_codon:yes gene_type:complete
MSDSTNKFFIIKVTKWSHTTTYEIMKQEPFSLEDATRNLLAYEQLNDNKDVKYHLNRFDEFLTNKEEPLVLNKEVA